MDTNPPHYDLCKTILRAAGVNSNPFRLLSAGKSKIELSDACSSVRRSILSLSVILSATGADTPAAGQVSHSGRLMRVVCHLAADDHGKELLWHSHSRRPISISAAPAPSDSSEPQRPKVDWRPQSRKTPISSDLRLPFGRPTAMSDGQLPRAPSGRTPDGNCRELINSSDEPSRSGCLRHKLAAGECARREVLGAASRPAPLPLAGRYVNER